MKYRAVALFAVFTWLLCTQLFAENTIDACGFPGTNMAEKIHAAILSAPEQGAAIDARCFTGSQTWPTNPWNGITKPGSILFGDVSITAYNSNFIPSNWTVAGGGIGVTVLNAVANTHILVLATENVSNVRIQNLEINGQGAETISIGIQIRGSTSVWVKDCYLHDANSANIGVDTNNPHAFSKDIWISENQIGRTYAHAIYNIQVGNSKNVHIIGNRINDVQMGQFCIGVDGGNQIEIRDNYLNGGGTVSGGIQIEATDYPLVSQITIAGNRIEGFSGGSGIHIVAVHNNTLRDASLLENSLRNVSRGIAIGNFNGENGAVLQKVEVLRNTIAVNGCCSGIYVWAWAPAPISGIQIANNNLAGAGKGDGNGDIVLRGTRGLITQFSVSGNRIQRGTSGNYGICPIDAVSDGSLASNNSDGDSRRSLCRHGKNITLTD